MYADALKSFFGYRTQSEPKIERRRSPETDKLLQMADAIEYSHKSLESFTKELTYSGDLMEAVMRASAILIDPKATWRVLDQILPLIGEVVQTSRIYVYEFDQADVQSGIDDVRFKYLAEWTNDGISTTIDLPYFQGWPRHSDISMVEGYKLLRRKQIIIGRT